MRTYKFIRGGCLETYKRYCCSASRNAMAEAFLIVGFRIIFRFK
jgi:formylglycine-generating enzyme required for sulfatase activity